MAHMPTTSAQSARSGPYRYGSGAYRGDSIPIRSPGVAFRDRAGAGKRLAAVLADAYAGRSDVLVLALPRGGVPIGVEVADALGAELDLMLVRKLGVPGHRELAMGAVATGGVSVLNQDVTRALGIGYEVIDAVAGRERAELMRRERAYRGAQPPVEVEGRALILVDDGLATGATMRAAVESVQALRPAEVVVAVPVAPEDTCRELEEVADKVICLESPEPFLAIGAWYERFPEVTDNEVRALLDRGQAG